MLNNDKIRLMTELSLDEKHYGKESFEIKDYFKSDYISKAMIKSFFGFTFCYLLILAIELMYSIQIVLDTVNIMDVVDIIFMFILQYAIGLIVFEAITWYVSSRRYNKAVKNYSAYMAKLKLLNKRYEDISKQGGHK